MTTKDKAEFVKLAKAELARTISRIEEYRELTKPISPENAIGRVSRMDAINNKSVNEAALRQTELKQKGLEYALAKIDDPDFGLCARCKKPIPIQRMLLVPHNHFCVRCAS